MKKILIGIFAHPDDEAFGPSGTLLKLHEEGYKLHLVLLTRGEAGANPDNISDLGTTRLQEWQRAAVLLGVSSHTALSFPDGGLQNTPTDEIDTAINNALQGVLTALDEISVMSFEPHGLTGHLDHIVASEAAQRLFRHIPNPRELWYYCLDASQAPLNGTAYYEPQSREDSFINRRIDVSQWLSQKYTVMDQHYSQRNDAGNAKVLGDRLLSTECFHVISTTDRES
ncbi:MAG: PIG-L deacetylase family protein [Candidatus Saccharimonadales bacterium]